jgi:hypothetical protein
MWNPEGVIALLVGIVTRGAAKMQVIKIIKCSDCGCKFEKPNSSRKRCVRCYAKYRNNLNARWQRKRGMRPQKEISDLKRYHHLLKMELNLKY